MPPAATELASCVECKGSSQLTQYHYWAIVRRKGVVKKSIESSGYACAHCVRKHVRSTVRSSAILSVTLGGFSVGALALAIWLMSVLSGITSTVPINDPTTIVTRTGPFELKQEASEMTFLVVFVIGLVIIGAITLALVWCVVICVSLRGVIRTLRSPGVSLVVLKRGLSSRVGCKWGERHRTMP
jgi:hypothetical protein